ncbi:MraY family glycosyltransferase [Mesorhizobium tamadayense]|uniref:MraY family glycosyltransferase n=1 Tax=Mesorhizobium tamadayense TaxID=425306 RepID=UPI001FDF5051|nr:MraY family glycosyltransferase [Mesorhizobium tamadayense]
MLDHADGLAAGTAAAAFFGLGGDIGMAGAGACMGFLCFNYPPACVFMGDSGSLLLGAAIMLLASERGLGSSLALIAVPLIDALFVIIRRLREGRRPWVGGTDHLGHTLLRIGVRTQGFACPACGNGLSPGARVYCLAKSVAPNELQQIWHSIYRSSAESRYCPLTARGKVSLVAPWSDRALSSRPMTDARVELAISRHLIGSRNLLPERSDRLQQFAFAGESVPKKQPQPQPLEFRRPGPEDRVVHPRTPDDLSR